MLFAVLFSAWRLQSAGWTENLGHIRTIAVIGFGVGLALGYSRYQKRAVILLTIGYFLAISIWQLLGTITFDPEQTYLWDRLVILFGKLFTDLNELFAGRPVKDQFFVIVLMCFPYWFASLYSGYQLTRYANFLGTVLPNGVLMFIVHVYHYTTKDYTWMFGMYLFLSLLLLSRMKYREDRRKWAKERVQVSSESELDIINTTVAVATVLVMLAWVTPYTLPAIAAGKEFWRKTYGEVFPSSRFEKIFASVEKESQPKPRNFQQELALGIRTPQSDLVVFQVYVPSNANDFPRLYWRGQIYDRYENGHWLTTSQTETRRKSSNGDIEVPKGEFSKRLTFTFDVRVDGQTIMYTASQPVSVNHDSILLYSDLSEDDELLDIMAMRASPPLKAGDLYRNSSLIANPTIPDMRSAGQAYPEWVTEKYLQLPANFSPRIRSLAAEIAQPYNNPYDKTVAITSYLRREIEYAGVVYIPDGTVEPLEYVLFVSKKGFCNYSASAEVLMLRSLGIPARLAVGYAQGEPNLQDSIYIVRERDLHAWPEVYFPEIGWVEFEPTGNQQPLERPEERKETAIAAPIPNPNIPQVLPEEQEPLTPDRTDQEQTSALSWQNRVILVLPWLGGVFVVLLAVVLKRRFAPNVTAASVVKRVVERTGWTPPRWLSRWLLFAGHSVIEQHFQSINVSLWWMKRPQPVHATAIERARLLKTILPEASESIDILLNEHQSQLFSAHGGNETLSRRAAWDILRKSVRSRLKISILRYN
jgi:transglutaminase-like putative cysteine protease/predicted transporter